jgi:hypothetical protein
MDAILEKLLANADPLLLVLVLQFFMFTKQLGGSFQRVEDKLGRLAEKMAAAHGAPDTPAPFRPAQPAPADDGYRGTD